MHEMRRQLARFGTYVEDLSRRAVSFAYRQYDSAVGHVQQLKARWAGTASGSAARPAPGRPVPPSRVPDGTRVYAFGDVHGRADLLVRLFDKVEADIAASAGDDRVTLVFLGDYIDRGFQSKDVIDFLLSERVTRHDCVYLKGNHEEAFLKFLQDPGFGPRWAGYGGLETLTSYGVRPPRTRTQAEEWVTACEALRDALPIDHRAFLNRLDISVTIGDYVFVHAGLRPGRAIKDQTEQDALWIREDFLNDTSSFGPIVVHGHTPISEPHRDYRRIGIDTGAYLSGRLTAACFVRDEVHFLTT